MSGTKKSTTGKVGKVEGNPSTAKAEAEQKALENADAELKAEAEAETNVQLKGNLGLLINNKGKLEVYNIQQ